MPPLAPARLHAAEAEVVGAGVRGALAAGAGLVGRAILVGTQVRAAPHHALGDARLARVETVAGALRVDGRPAAGRETGVVIVAVPVGTPLPDVARHVVEAVAVGRERPDRG